MTTRINIPTYFQRYTNGLDVVEVKGTTVGECLNDLVSQSPDINRQQQRKFSGESRESISSTIMFRHSGQ